MMRAKNHNLIFFSTILYYAGSYIAGTIYAGQLILVLAVGLMAIAVFSNTGGKIPIRNSGFIKYILVFLLFCIASRLWAEDPSLSGNKINGLIFILIGMIIINLCYLGYTCVEDLLKAIMYGGYIVVLFAFFRYGLGGIIRLAANDVRMTNDLLNANALGMCAAYALVLNFFFIFYEHIRFRDLLMLPAIVLLIVSQSRKAIVIVALGVIAIYILRNFNKSNFGLTVLKLLGGLILLAAVFVVISRFSFMQPIVKRLNEILEMFAGRGTRSNNSAWIRFAYIDLGIELFKRNPLLGIGIGNANIYTQMYYHHNHYLHNNYVELLACGGIIGFLIYYSMHLYLLFNFIKYRNYHDKEYDICLVLLMLNLIIDYGIVTYYDKANYLFLFVIWLKIKAMREQYGKKKISIQYSRANKIKKREVLS